LVPLAGSAMTSGFLSDEVTVDDILKQIFFNWRLYIYLSRDFFASILLGERERI
jgi:hypothetical protein